MVLKNFKTIRLAFFGIAVLCFSPVQGQGLLGNFLSGDSTKSNTKQSTGTTKKPQPASQSKSDSPLLELLSTKTPQEKAKEEAARKKAADARAKSDAKNKAIAAAEKKKTDELKAREQATREKAKAQERAAELAKQQKDEAMAALQRKKVEEQKARDLDARERQKASEKAAELLVKQKADAEKAKRIEEEEKADAARKLALAEMRQKEEKARQLLATVRAREAALRAVEEEKLRAQREIDAELIAHAHGRSSSSKPFGGLFGSRSRMNVVTQQKPQGVGSPPNRYLYINEREISRLNSANSRLEIDLGDQRARVYRGSILVIETQISSGKPGYSTPTGRFIIQEKLVEKKSGRYGTWYDGSGAELRGDDSFDPPPGAAQFVGADMPYWLRLTDGIGMHVGFVPDGPASHGCIRVPSNVQPLIFSKVGIGTPVLVRG